MREESPRNPEMGSDTRWSWWKKKCLWFYIHHNCIQCVSVPVAALIKLKWIIHISCFQEEHSLVRVMVKWKISVRCDRRYGSIKQAPQTERMKYIPELCENCSVIEHSSYVHNFWIFVFDSSLSLITYIWSTCKPCWNFLQLVSRISLLIILLLSFPNSYCLCKTKQPI